MTLTIERRGTHPQGVGNNVGIAVPMTKGSPANTEPGEQGSTVGGAGLRSLPAKQHAPKVRPMRWVPLAGLEPATCCLEDMSAPSSLV